MKRKKDGRRIASKVTRLTPFAGIVAGRAGAAWIDPHYTGTVKIIDNLSGELARDLEIVRSTAREIDLAVWLVGGPVRDALLGREVRDLDFLVEQRVEQLAEAVAGKLDASLTLHRAFMTAKVTTSSGRSLDFTTARTETYPSPGSLPVVHRSSASADLLRRDFSINAIACDVSGTTVLDPAEGRRDLERRLIRVLHAESFSDDPTRIFRALRLAARLDFEIEQSTMTLLRGALSAGALKTVSSQRIWRELVLCIHEPDPAAAFRALIRNDVLQSWTGAARVDDQLEAILSRLAIIGGEIPALDLEVLYLAVLLGGMPGAAVPQQLPLSRGRFALLDSLLSSGDAMYAQWSETTADMEKGRLCLGRKPEEIAAIAVRHEDPVDVLRTWREIRGTILPFGGAALEIAPGPHVGKALEETRLQAWINGGTPEELLEFARRSALRYLNEQQT